jgi:hypothetical protein
MKNKVFRIYYKEGFKIAQEMKLNNINNWTPLLVYLHVSRMIIGFILGTIFGALIIILFNSL